MIHGGEGIAGVGTTDRELKVSLEVAKESIV